MTDQDIIDVVTAHRDGKQIQFREITEKHDRDWLDIDDPTFRFHDCVYRVKPEPPKPREWWLGFHKDLTAVGESTYGCIRVYPNQPEGWCTGEIIHVREVLP